MGRSAVFEGVNIFLNSCNGDAVVGSTLSQEFWVVDSLSTTGNFLTSHEEVVRVSVVGVLRVNHGIERSSIGRISVEHIEVSVELLLHDLTESLFVGSVQILEGVLLKASLSEELDSFFEVEADILALELLERILFIDNCQFFSILSLKTIEDVNEHFRKEIKDFEVVLLEYHLDIEACELAQVTISV